jgi:hypothetical protein
MAGAPPKDQGWQQELRLGSLSGKMDPWLS